MNPEMLTALLTGQLAFKVFNPTSQTWELVKLHIPELDDHKAQVASTSQVGHVRLSSDFESESEQTAPTSKSLKTVFDSVVAHVNDDESHVSPELINKIAELETSNAYLQQKVVSLENYMPEGVHVTTWGGLYGEE